MSVKSDIGNGIITLSKMGLKGLIPEGFSAEVISVERSTRSCTVRSISNGPEVEYPNVWLMPEVADGLLIIPKKGSTVIVQSHKNLQPYVSMFSAVDEIMYVVDGQNAFYLNKDGIKLCGDKYGGLLEVIPTVKAFNDLQKDVNNLKGAFQTLLTRLTTDAAAGGGSGATTPVLVGTLLTYMGTFTTYSTSALTPTVRKDLENTKVKHGDKH